MSLLYDYLNGNYRVKIYSDGTKERILEDKEINFNPLYPESIDLKITNCCDLCCDYCHEKSNIFGVNGNLNLPFLDSLPRGIELAIGGGNVFEHKDLENFLVRMKDNDVICNITINHYHFITNLEKIKYFIDKKLVRGVGVSLPNNYKKDIEKLRTLVYVLNNYDFKNNIVLHCIAGVTEIRVLQFLSRELKHNKKLLILGYKKVGRGEKFYENENKLIDKKIEEYKNNLLLIQCNFEVVGFDNLAIEQLNVKFSNDEYMGGDGEFSMYIDLVSETFSVSSSTKENSKEIRFNYLKEMFQEVKRMKLENLLVK